MSIPTTYMGLPNPTVGGDPNTWGTSLNTCITGFDTLAVANVLSVSSTVILGVYNGPVLVKATSAGGITLTFPDATIAANKGRIYIIVKVDSPAGIITLAGNGGQTFSGQTNPTISTQWEGLIVQSDGSNWIITNTINATNGILSVTDGGTGSNLSTTGGTSQVLKQTTVGGNITVGQLGASDLTNGVTGSGAVVLATGATFVTSNPIFPLQTGTGNIVLSDSPTFTTTVGLPSATLAGKVTTYDAQTTAGQGLAPILTFSATTPTTPVSSTPVLVSAPAGLYRVTYYSVVTTTGVGGTDFVLNLIYTDAFGSQTIPAFTNSTFTAGDVNQGSFVIQNQSINDIRYSITEDGTFSTHPVLALQMTLERLA